MRIFMALLYNVSDLSDNTILLLLGGGGLLLSLGAFAAGMAVAKRQPKKPRVEPERNPAAVPWERKTTADEPTPAAARKHPAFAAASDTAPRPELTAEPLQSGPKPRPPPTVNPTLPDYRPKRYRWFRGSKILLGIMCFFWIAPLTFTILYLFSGQAYKFSNNMAGDNPLPLAIIFGIPTIAYYLYGRHKYDTRLVKVTPNDPPPDLSRGSGDIRVSFQIRQAYYDPIFFGKQQRRHELLIWTAFSEEAIALIKNANMYDAVFAKVDWDDGIDIPGLDPQERITVQEIVETQPYYLTRHSPVNLAAATDVLKTGFEAMKSHIDVMRSADGGMSGTFEL